MGFVTVIPDVGPTALELVAVKVPPPANVTAASIAQDIDPLLALDMVEPAPPFRKIGTAELAWLQLNPLVMVIVPVPMVQKLGPVILKFAKVGLPLVANAARVVGVGAADSVIVL